MCVRRLCDVLVTVFWLPCQRFPAASFSSPVRLSRQPQALTQRRLHSAVADCGDCRKGPSLEVRQDWFVDVACRDQTLTSHRKCRLTCLRSHAASVFRHSSQVTRNAKNMSVIAFQLAPSGTEVPSVLHYCNPFLHVLHLSVPHLRTSDLLGTKATVAEYCSHSFQETQ